MMCNAKAVIQKRILFTKAYVSKYASTLINLLSLSLCSYSNPNPIEYKHRNTDTTGTTQFHNICQKIM